MKRHWRYIFPIFAAAGIGISLVAWSGRGTVQSSEISPGARDPRKSQVIHAEATLICQEGAEVTLGSQLAGQIKRVLVKEGQTVRAGELLAELEASEQQAQLDEAQARLAESMIDEKFENSNFDRMKLLSQHGTVSREQFDRSQHEAERAIAQTEVDRAIAARLAAELRKSRITAPFDAIVVQRLVNDQEEVAAGAPVIKLADLSRTWVEAQVDELDAAQIQVGARAAVAIEGYPDRTWQGQVIYIAPEMTRRTEISADPSEPTRAQVLRVRIELKNSAPFKLKQRLEAAIDTEPNSIATAGTLPKIQSLQKQTE